ncbi:MAG: Release factor glutamine methyltransferase [Turneriella sp.]|nr:Release factor glutamine methyltransferase [Turneriella sp.]
MTLIEVLRKAEEYLCEKKVPSPRLEAQILFAHFLRLKRIELFTQPERPLEEKELALLRTALREKALGKPTAYILGEKNFFEKSFLVNESVLIPRPETEELVEHILHRVSHAPRIADLGTGSGCIGIALAERLGCKHLALVDISKDALAVAKENTVRNLAETKTEVEYLLADFTQADLQLSQKMDLIVSNPPYVFAREFSGLDKSVSSFEPRVALVAEDFSFLHTALLKTIFRNLAEGGLFALETHPEKSAWVAETASNLGFAKVELINDLAKRPHFVIGSRK